MKQKRGQLGIIFLCIIIFLVIVSIIVSLSFLNKKYSEDTTQINYISLYIKSTDKDSQNNIESNYILQDFDNIISNGTLSDWTEIKVDSSKQYILSCWNKEHYLSSFKKVFSSSELDSNSSRLICELNKVRNLKVFHKGELTEKLNILSVNISSDYFKKLTICEAHTIGIISVDLLNKEIRCDSGSWRNWTEINYTTRQPIFLENDTYVCGMTDWFTYCKNTIRNLCYYKKTPIPNNLKNEVDNCFYIGKNLINSSINLDFQVNVFNLNNQDNIQFYILDQDQRLIDNSFQYVYYIENNGNYEDIGLENYKYSI